MKYYFRSNIYRNDNTLRALVFWKNMGAQILVYSYLPHHRSRTYKLERPELFLSRVEKQPFQFRD